MQVEIVSAEGEIFSGKAKMISVTGAMGELGILSGHAPLLTTLLPGPIYLLIDDNKEEVVFVSGGIIEVQPTEVTVLADTVVRLADTDEKEIMLARENAERALLNIQQRDCDFAEIKRELARTAGLLKALHKLRNTTHK